MAFLQKKKIKGRVYYYLRENKRINGKPRLAWEIYLGSAERLKELYQKKELNLPNKVRHYHFGEIAALLSIEKELGLAKIIDKYVPKKRNKDLSVGLYILLIVINRALDPKSKRGIAKWYRRGILQHLFKVSPSSLKSQNFWTHMDYLDKEKIDAIQTEILEVLIDRFHLDLGYLFYDTTNFFTFLEEHKGNRLPARGKNKAGRHHLRQINLALLVTRKFHIPLLHSPYEGNTHDAKRFKESIKEFIAKYPILATRFKDITLVFDKGNNSYLNLAEIDESDYHFIGSLIPCHHKELLEIPLDVFTRQGELLVYRLKKEVFGEERTIVITYNERLYQKQLKRTLSLVEKQKERLASFEKEQLNTHKWRSKKTVTKKIEEILSCRETKGLIAYHLRKKGGRLYLRYYLDEDALKEKKKGFGKNILFTDNHSWSTQEIVDAYRQKNNIEEAFKVMHNSEFACFMPMYHWTDQKIRVHALTCVLALLFLSLLRMKLHQHGLCLSIEEILETLSDIKLIRFSFTKGKTSYLISERDELQQKICSILNIDQYAI